ncbi:protein of unknown function [Ralstonia solanacearum CMR15]|nr:protein of unknown function [Ralstonia solanacearum CMR15]
MKTIRRFVCDSLIARPAKKPCGCAKCTAKRSSTKDTREPVDLNEIHRRFWAKLAGKK